MKKTLAVDFDGVIHAYSQGWKDGVIYDVPVKGVLTALDLLADKYRVVVFTARDDLDAVYDWLDYYEFSQFIEDVTNVKPKAWAYIDDRGVRFESWEQTIKMLSDLDPSDDWSVVL